jgi:hypothetical protein
VSLAVAVDVSVTPLVGPPELVADSLASVGSVGSVAVAESSPGFPGHAATKFVNENRTRYVKPKRIQQG